MGTNFGLPSGEIIAAEDADQRLDAITQSMLRHALRSVSMHGDFHIVLSSNEVLDAVYCRLMYDPDLRAMPWQQTHVWFLDSHNKELIEETIIMHSGIPEEHVHRCNVEPMIDDDPSFRLDCCVLELDDVSQCPQAVRQCSEVVLILAEDRDKLASVTDVHVHGNVYWFTATIDLSQENP